MRILLSSLALTALAATGACASAPQGGASGVSGDYLSGRLAARVNALDDAARVYAEAHRAAPDQAPILKDAFFYHIAAGDVDAAIPFARAILASKPKEDDGLARAVVAAAEIKAGRYEAARSAMTGDIAAPFIKSLAFLSDVWIEKELNGARAALQKLKNPGKDIFDGFNPLHEAFLSEEAGSKDQARAAYEIAVAGIGGPLARRGYGAFLERAGDDAKTREYYKILAAEEGSSRRAAEMALRRLDRRAPSRQFSQVNARMGVAAAYYQFAQAMIEEAAGQREQAEKAGFKVGEPRFNFPLVLARMAVFLDPTQEEARRLVGAILNVYGDYDGAATVLGAIPPASPFFEQARIDIAAGLSAGEKPKAAEKVLKEALRRDPKGRDLKWSLAAHYAEMKDHEKAVAAISKLIVELGEPPPAEAWRYHVSRGASLIELDRWPEAEKDLKRAVELAPDEPMALNYLGYSWAERGLNLEEAFNLLDKAVAARPDSGAIVDSLGWAHFQLGQYDQAVGHLERAAALEPSDPTVTEHLGDVYWRLGRDIEALYQWRMALELEATEAQRKAIEKKLVDGMPPPAQRKAAD